MSAILRAEGLRKRYRDGDGTVLEVLRGVELAVARGEFVAIMGESGCGKSSLLHVLGALDDASGGDVWLDGQSYAALTPTGLAALRNRKLGFVFQFHHLLREFSAQENVVLPQLMAGVPEGQARARAEDLLARVGVSARRHVLPATLSGGERQRVAIARALALDPVVLLADEPTGNLDERNAAQVLALFASLARQQETAVVVVTHNRHLARAADRVLLLEHGQLAPVPLVEVAS